MPSKKSVSVTELLSEILDGDIDNLEEIAERKGEEAGERVSENFAEGIEKGIRKGGRKVSGSVQVGMADFANELIKAVEKLSKAPLRGQGRGFTIDMSKLITPDWSKVGVGKKNEANVQQAFSNMLQNVYKKRKSLGGSNEAVMNSFAEEAITYINEFASNAKAGNSKSISAQLNKALRKSEKELNTRLTQREHEKESYNEIKITKEEIDRYLSKTVEELVKIVESTYRKKNPDDRTFRNNADKKTLVASVTALLAKNNNVMPSSLTKADEVTQYIEDLMAGKIYHNIGNDPKYKQSKQTEQKNAKMGRELAAVRDAIIQRNEDWKNGKVSEVEISNEETKTVVENEKKKTKATKSAYRQRQELIKQEQKENEERREQVKKEAEQDLVVQNKYAKRSDINWEKDEKGNYRGVYNGKEYFVRNNNKGKSYSLMTVGEDGSLQDTGYSSKSIRKMQGHVLDLIRTEQERNAVKEKNIELNKQADEQAKNTVKTEEEIAQAQRIRAKQEESENNKKKKALLNNSGGAELAAQRQKEDAQKRAARRNEAEENKKAIAAAEEAEKQANEEINKQAEEMYKAELERRKKLSKITFDRKKDKNHGLYWGSDGDTYAKKEGRTYTIFDKFDNKIAEGLKNLDEVDSAAQKFYKSAYDDYKKSRNIWIQGFKNDIKAGLYQKPKADVVGGSQEVVESEKQVQDAVEQSAQITKQAEEEKQQAIEETTQKISEQAKVQNEQSSQTPDASKDVVKTQEEVAKAAEESAEREAKAAEKSAEAVAQAEEKKQEAIKESSKIQDSAEQKKAKRRNTKTTEELLNGISEKELTVLKDTLSSFYTGRDYTKSLDMLANGFGINKTRKTQLNRIIKSLISNPVTKANDPLKMRDIFENYLVGNWRDPDTLLFSIFANNKSNQSQINGKQYKVDYNTNVSRNWMDYRDALEKASEKYPNLIWYNKDSNDDDLYLNPDKQQIEAIIQSEQSKQEAVKETTEAIKEQAKVQEEANSKTTLEQLAPEPTKKDLQEIEEKEIQLKKEAEEARKVEEEARRQAEEETRRAEEIKKKAEEERLKAEEEKKRAEEEKAKADAEAARKEAEEKKRQAEEEQRKAEEEKKKAEEEKRKAEEKAQKEKEKAEKKAAEAKRKAEEEARKIEEAKRKAEEEAAKKAEIDARKAKMAPVSDEDIVKHSYGESGASTTVYSPHLGKTVTVSRTSEGDSFYGTQMNYQELEKRAIAVSNELEVVRANIRIEEEKGVSSSEKRIANLQQEESILKQNLEYIRAIAEAEAENDDEVENPGYTIEQFDRNVQDGTELFSAKLATKTDKEIESIQRANERFHTKVQAFVAKNNAYLAKIDPIYQRDQAFSDVQNAVNSFSPINEDDYKKAELEIKNKINILERIMGLARSNLKGSNTLSTEKSAEYRLSDAPDDINEIVNGYIKLGLTAEEAEDKVAGLRDAVTDINNRNNNKGGTTGDLGWTGAEDYSKAVGDLLNNIRIARNEQVKYRNDIKAVREEENKATSALEKYLSAQEKVESGKDTTGKYAQQAKNQIAIYEQAIKTRAEYIKQNKIVDGIDSEWETKQTTYKQNRENSIKEQAQEARNKAEQDAQSKILQRQSEENKKALIKAQESQKKANDEQAIDAFKKKRNELKEALKKYYSEATSDPSILDDLRKNVLNLQKEALDILDKSSLDKQRSKDLRNGFVDSVTAVATNSFNSTKLKYDSDIDKFEKELLKLGYTSEDVKEKILELRKTLINVEPGQNLFGVLDPLTQWKNELDKKKQKTRDELATSWLNTNRSEDISNIVSPDLFKKGHVKIAQKEVTDLQQKLRDGLISTKKYESEYDKLTAKWSNAISAFDNSNGAANREVMESWMRSMAQGADLSLRWSKDGNQLTGTFIDQNNQLQKLVATADKSKGVIRGVVQETKEASTGLNLFFESIGTKFQEVLRYFATYASLRTLWSEFQKGIAVIREYDKALTEMNKVSESSFASLQQFQKESFAIADSVGVTGSVIQNSTADWMRLGESLEQAKESAKSAAILFNVSEFQDIGSATEALVSASQAYQELSKTEIIDKINYIGNNYSIATDGLASALQRSAAVLKTQGNDLNEAIALITAGNSIIQDPEMVAAGLRTISLRIAGTKEAKDELVSLGEDVDDFIVGTEAKKRQIIKDYTAVASNAYKGVDIIDPNGNLKSTYEILLEISKVYKEIQDTDKRAGTNRAQALVEELAGKNRSNIAASVLSNPEMLEKVYTDSLINAEGSAQEELDKQLASIEGHVNRLKNTYDEMWTSAANREVINFFIDIANSILNVVSNLGLLKTTFASLFGVLEFQGVMSGGGFLFGKKGILSNTFGGGKKNNEFDDLQLDVIDEYNKLISEGSGALRAKTEATRKANETTKRYIQTQVQLGNAEQGIDKERAEAVKKGKGQKGFSGILENGKSILKGLAASAGTAIISFAAEQVLSAVFTTIDQNYIHAYEHRLGKFKDAQASYESDQNELNSIEAQIDSIEDRIHEINALGGAKIVKDGELQRLEEQKAELEAQKELKQAILEMDMLDMYRSARDVANTEVMGWAYEQTSRKNAKEGTEDVWSWTQTKQSQPDALRNTMKYYNEIVEAMNTAREDYLRLEKEDVQNGTNLSDAAKQKYESLQKTATDLRGEVSKITSEMDATATTLSSWEKQDHVLSETEQAFINATEEGKKFIVETKDMSISITAATNAQKDYTHACVQTSAQITDQKAKVDTLKTSYQEIFSLLSSFTGTDIVLDDTQLQKYAYALEYINGVYTLNKEKLLEVAKANNAVERSNLEEVRRTERMQLLDNIDEIEIYNQKLQEGQKVYNGIDIQDYISQLKQENAQILNNCKVYDYQISQIDNMTSAYQRWLDTGDVSKDSKQFTDVQSSAKNLEELIKTGYFNSEAASHEIDFIIPEGVSRDDKSAILKLAKEYNEYFADGIKGTNKFVKKAMKETLENGTPLIKQLEDGNYEFGEGVTVQDFMDKFGWSESAIRAMLQELHEAQGWNIDWSLENLDTLEDKVVHSQQVISDYESQIKELETTKSQRTLTEEETKRLDDLRDKLSEVKKEYAEMRDEFSKQLTSNIRDTIKENGGAQTISEGIPEDASDKEISDYLKGKTGVKSEYEVRVYTEDAQKNIEDLEAKYKELEELYNNPLTPKARKSTIKDTMDEIQVEMDSEKLNLSLLSMLEFDSDGISTESTTQNILSIVGSIDKTLGRIADKVAPPTKIETIGQTVKGKFDGLSKKQPTTIQKIQNKVSSAFEVPNVAKNPKQVVTEIIKQKVETEVEALNADKVTALFETLRKKQEETTGVKSSTVTVYGIERTLQQFRELYRMQQLVHSGGVYDSSYNPGGAHQVKGNAFARGNDIVGEQGRELVVDPNRGIWYTVGDSGTEMIDLPKDAIVYSHNQTEALLKSGVTTRGKSKGRSFANGNQQYVFGNIDLRHRQPYYWDDGSVSTVLGTSYGMDELSFAVATLLQGNDVRPLGDGEVTWYLEQLVSRSHDPETIYALDRQGFTDEAGNWLHDLIAYVGTDAAQAEYVASIMHEISDEYERSIGTYSKGNAFANGTLVGERGRELVVDPNTGRWYTVGDYGSEMINLPKDAIVYNHQQTEDLLKNGHTGRGHSTGASFVDGNAYAGGPIGGGGGLESSTSDGKDAAKSAEKAAKSAEKAAKDAKKATDEAKNNMIWIDRAIEHQERKVSKINELVEDDFQTYTERLSNLGELREELSLQNEILTDALERRVEEFDKAFKELVEIFGEDMATDLLHKIEVGSVDKDTYKDEFGEDEAGEKKKKALDKVIDAYDEETKLSDKLRDNEKEIRDAIQKEYEFRLNIIEAEKDQLQFEMDTLEHNLDMKDILGKMVTEGDYQDMIDQSEEIADNIERTIDVLEEQLTTVDEGSAKYNEINSQLISAKKELQDIEKQQAEWNEKIMRLPIERLDKYIGMLENIKKDLQNWISERDTLNIQTLGKTMEDQYSLAQEQVEAYQKKEKMYLDLMKNYEYGSEKFHETADEIQACQDSVSGLIQEMEELNMQFLKLPIDEISKANEKLQQINSAEQRVLDDYDTALSAVLSLFDKQIDKLNDQKDYWDEYYENLIKPEQEKLDLLNEQNEAKQMQYNIDKAQYDLDKARQQKNVQVVRNGRIEYDSDYDAVKNAQDNLANAQHDKVIYDIQQVIDGYDKLNEKKQEELDDEIDAYEDARNRWQTFEDERTFEKESAEALRLFGEGWEQNIINRTDDREYDIFSKGHIELDRQITANEKQIEANDKMIDLMTRYADAFLSGEMTYEEAVAQYNKLYNDYQSDGALTSQEALAAELAFNKADNMASALTGNNAITKEQYDSFLKQLEDSNKYKGIYEGLQKSWTDMAADIKSQLAELKRLAELAEQIAGQRNSKTIGYSHDDDDDGGGGVWSKNPTGYGAGTKYNPTNHTIYGSPYSSDDAVRSSKSIYIDNSGGDTTVESKSTEVKSSSSSSSSGHYNHSSASGPASDPELHADGLAGGIIGNISPTEKFKKLQAMGLKPLEPDEVPAFLHVGEGVVNAIQQGNILKSVANAYKSGVASNVAVQPNASSNTYQFDLSFGDITLPDVRDVDGFARSMKMNFESAMNQQFSKIFKN